MSMRAEFGSPLILILLYRLCQSLGFSSPLNSRFGKVPVSINKNVTIFQIFFVNIVFQLFFFGSVFGGTHTWS